MCFFYIIMKMGTSMRSSTARLTMAFLLNGLSSGSNSALLKYGMFFIDCFMCFDSSILFLNVYSSGEKCLRRSINMNMIIEY